MKKRKLFFGDSCPRKIHLGAPDKHYGLAEPLVEFMSDEELSVKKEEFINQLKIIDRKEIECSTREQSLNHLWYQERKIRLTASNFGEICKMRAYTSCKNKVHGLLYKIPIQTKEMTYGHETEGFARKQFEKMYEVDVQLCGLMIDPDIPYLAASPGE